MSEYSELRGRIQRFMLDATRDVDKNGEDYDRTTIAGYDERIGHIEGERVKRFVIHFRSRGCLWQHINGGCSMCGFWEETTQFKVRVSAADFVTQFTKALDDHHLGSYPVLSLYNAGSLLQEEETPFSAVEEICHLIARQLPELKRLIIESRVEYITREKLLSLQKILGSQTQLALGIGFESENDLVRNVLVNKGASKRVFERVVDLTSSLDIHSIVYLLVKPPFLTEREAIEDVVNSCRYVSDVGVREINLETMTVEAKTLVSTLHEKGLYALPWLWSIVEVLERTAAFADPFLTPFSYIAESVATPRNCRLCSERVIDRIYNQYCSDFDRSHLVGLHCACKSEWLRATSETSSSDLHTRALDMLDACGA